MPENKPIADVQYVGRSSHWILVGQDLERCVLVQAIDKSGHNQQNGPLSARQAG
ncbi:MAG: hypothetical protein Q9171_005239 [Xanthocarpia ochracea]